MFVKFFRNRAIKAFLKKKDACILPDVTTCKTVAILVNGRQLANVKDATTTLKKLFLLEKLEFFVLTNEVSSNVETNGNVHFITKKDFGVFGLLKSEKQKMLSSSAFDLTMNLSNSRKEVLTEEYILTILSTNFRVSYGSSCDSLYDLIIDSKSDDMLVEIETLHRYLKMLMGK